MSGRAPLFVIADERKKERARRQKSARVAGSKAIKKLTELTAVVSDGLESANSEEKYRELSNAVLTMENELGRLRSAIVDVGMQGLRDRAKTEFLLDKINVGTPRVDWRASIIYCDPPWQYNDANHGNGARRKYDTMSDEALCAFPLPGLAAEDCVLLMWATMPRLDSAFKVMRAWGFEYKTVFMIWVKMQRYMGRLRNNNKGSYTQPNAEIVLIGTRGRPRSEVTRDGGFRQANVLLQRPQDHSAKPAIMRDIAVKIFGDVTRTEIFSRDDIPGWICCGNQAGGEHAVETEPESAFHASRNIAGVYNQKRGAGANERARRLTKRKSGVSRRGIPGMHTALERYDDAVCMSHSDYALMNEDEEEQRVKRARFIDDLEHDRESVPLDEVVSERELATIGRINTSSTRRNITYPQLTDADVRAHQQLIMAKQQHNSDTLFAFNRNKKNLVVKHQVEQFD